MDRMLRKRISGALGPFDHRDTPRVQNGCEVEELDLLRPLQTVEVDVKERHLSLVLLYERKGRARDEVLYAESGGEPLDERCLAASEISVEGDDRAGAQFRGEDRRDAPRLFR